MKILAFAGSARRDSFNKRVLSIATRSARAAGAEVNEIDLGDFPLPLYDGDLERASGLPENAVRLRQLMLEHQGLLLACPEYNSSITALMKNTLDWLSRPHKGESGRIPYQDKVAGLVAASNGNLGGVRGLYTVRQVLTALSVLVIPEQVAVARFEQLMGADGRLTDPNMQAAVEGVGTALARMVGRMCST